MIRHDIEKAWGGFVANRPRPQSSNTPTASQGLAGAQNATTTSPVSSVSLQNTVPVVQSGLHSQTTSSRRSSASQQSAIPMVQLGVQSAATGSPRPSSSQQSAVPVVQPNTSGSNTHGQGSIRSQRSNGSQRSSDSRKSTNSQGIRTTNSPMSGGSQPNAVPAVQPSTPGVSNIHGQGFIRRQTSNGSQRSSGSRKSTNSQGIRTTSSPMPGGSQQSAVPVVQPNTPGVSNSQGSIRSQRSNVSQRSSGSRKSTISQGISYSHSNAV
jgi:hypothetical protein